MKVVPKCPVCEIVSGDVLATNKPQTINRNNIDQ